MEKTYTSLSEEKESKPNIADLGIDYIETYYQLTLLQINKKTADISAVASFTMVGALVCLVTAIFLGIGVSLWLGKITGDVAVGFLLTGALALIIFLFLFFTRKKIFYPFVKNLIIKSMYE